MSTVTWPPPPVQTTPLHVTMYGTGAAAVTAAVPANAAATATAALAVAPQRNHSALAMRIAVAAVTVGGAAWAAWTAFCWHRRRAQQAAAAAAAGHPNQLRQFQKPLHHSYMMVRHGESTANVSGIISSDPAISTVEHGLTARGAEQVAEEVAQWSRTLPPNQPVVVISSDFTRARETAAIIHKRLRVRHPLMLHTQLRERYFGDWNGMGAENYERVWEADARSADHTQRKVESVHSVVRRSTQLIHEIETRLVDMMRAHLDSLSSSSDGLSSDSAAAAASARRMSHSLEAGSVPRYSVILVAHGDVCQILATAFANMDHRLHRSLPHWNNGEMRVLQWTPTQTQQQQQQNAQNAQPAQPQTSPVVSAPASSHAA